MTRTDEILLDLDPIQPRWIRFRGGRLFHLVNERRQTTPNYLVAATACGASGEHVANVVRGRTPGSRPICVTCGALHAASSEGGS